eukprot:13861994-Heterocapsa_arctica.AAC.1
MSRDVSTAKPRSPMEAGVFSALVRAAIASSRLFTSFSDCAALDLPRGLLRVHASANNGMGSPA